MKPSGSRSALAAAGILLALGAGFLWKQRVTGSGHGHPKSERPECGLYFAKENLCATLFWVRRPSAQELEGKARYSEFQLTFWRADAKGRAQAVSPPGQVLVSLWMPGMGHGSEETLVTRVASSEGQFRVEKVWFSMPGQWEIWVSLMSEGRFVEKAKLDFFLDGKG